MTEDQKYEIAVLAEDAHNKSERFALLSIMNTPVDSVERTKARIEYEIARAEWWEAEMRLAKARMRRA